MTKPLPMLDDVLLDFSSSADGDEAGFGSLATARGHLPLESMDVRARVDGLLAQVTVEQTFVNPADEPLEATYIFPMPDRAGVTGFRMEVAGRVIEGRLDERGRAREAYDQAVEAGHRAAIAEEERPGVFTMRVGNLMPGDRAKVRLTMAGPLPYADGEVTFRFPLVVAPRYVPGVPLTGPQVGDGVASDTRDAPDASRVSPPVLLRGFPNPVRLSLSVDLHGPVADPWAGGVRVSLHAAAVEAGAGVCRVRLLTEAGTPLDRDFILRYKLGGGDVRTALSFHPDPESEGLGSGQGTFALTVIPPAGSTGSAGRPKDVAFVLDRSGSMGGWKIVAARRALARMVDTLGPADRFALLAFDDSVESPPALGSGLAGATDRNRFRAVEYLAGVDARGGTEMAAPLASAAGLLAGQKGDTAGRDRVLVLITDGQVSNEAQILKKLKSLVAGTRVFALGIDRAVNEGFLNQLAGLGGTGGACELVESEERLDTVMDAVHRRIAAPVLTDLRLEPSGWQVLPGSLVPERTPAVFPDAPVLLLGRYFGLPGGLTLQAADPRGEPWSEWVEPAVRENPAVVSAWARGQVRKLDDRYLTSQGNRKAIEDEIVSTSLKFGVLSRFTAYVAVDVTEAVNPGGQVHKITQPVSVPQGWEEGKQLQAVASLAMGPQMLRASGKSRGIFKLQKRELGATDASMPSAPPSPSPSDSTQLGQAFDEVDEFFAPDLEIDSYMIKEEVSSMRLAGPFVPDVLSGFDAPRVIARGGLGTIYRAYDRARQREVTVKVVSSGTSGVSERFKALACRVRLQHSWILSVLEVVERDGNWLIVSEFIEGQTLYKLLQAGPPLSVKESTLLVYRLATALAYAQEQGLVYDDLSPSSVIIATGGTPHLVDEFAAPGSIGLPGVSGTPGYMPPERLDGSGRLEGSGNIYSLGVLLYRLLAGRLPFGGGLRKRIEAILRGQPVPPRRLNPEVSPALEAVCLKAMARRPEDRYATAARLAEELLPMLGGNPQATTPNTPPDPKSKKGGGRRMGFWK